MDESIRAVAPPGDDLSSAPQHTRGPWEMDEEGQIFSRGALVATVNVRQYPGENTWDWDTAGADGCLIAAAPDLLEALQRLLPHISAVPSAWDDHESGDDNSLYRACIDRARAAIVKARQA